MTTLEIKYPDDFESKCDSYKEKFSGPVEKKVISLPDFSNVSDADILSINLKSGLLSINKSTGVTKLNNKVVDFNTEQKEFKLLLKMITNKDYRAKYADLIGETPTKTNKRELSFVLRNLKEFLGILPQKKAVNKDIFMNIKNFGYRLLT